MTWATYTNTINSVFNAVISWLGSVSSLLITNKIFITIVFIAVLYVVFDFLFELFDIFKNKGAKNEEKNI